MVFPAPTLNEWGSVPNELEHREHVQLAEVVAPILRNAVPRRVQHGHVTSLDRSGLGNGPAVTDHVRSLGYRVVTTGCWQEFDLRGSVDGRSRLTLRLLPDDIFRRAMGARRD